MKKLFLFLAIGAAAASCKKSSTTVETCTVTPANIAGKYVITSATYQASSTDTPTDILATLNDCSRDDSYELKADGSIVISEENLRCGTPPMPGTPTDWSLAENNTVLVMGANLKIKSFDCKKLVVEENNSFTDGDIKITTYTKQ